MSKIMNQCYLGSDLEFMQELLGEDSGYLKYLNEMDKQSSNQLDMSATRGSDMGDYSKMYESESKFLKAGDLKGQAFKVKISGAKVEPMTQDAGGDQKLVVYFDGREKGMALNKTNYKVLSGSFGHDTDQWTGKEIEIFSMDVEYQGNLVPGLRCRVLVSTGYDMPDDNIDF